LILDEPLPDWRDWQFLEVDVEGLRPVPVRIVVRVHDRAYDLGFRDRYNEAFELPAYGRTRLRIPLATIRDAPESRPMNMAAIAGVGVYTVGRSQIADGFRLLEIRLAN
jgi:hypothetical protein